MSFIYITAPYLDEPPATRKIVHMKTSYYYTSLLIKKQYAYSPIIAHHGLIEDFDLDTEAAAWMAQNFAMLASAKELHMLTFNGWASNIMMLAELNFWRAMRPESSVYYVDTGVLDKARTNRKLTRGKLSCAPVLKDG
jgi:hypothetical protein